DRHQRGTGAVARGKLAADEQWDTGCSEEIWADDVIVGRATGLRGALHPDALRSFPKQNRLRESGGLHAGNGPYPLRQFVQKAGNRIALQARLARIDGHQQEVVAVESNIYAFEVAQRAV